MNVIHVGPRLPARVAFGPRLNRLDQPAASHGNPGADRSTLHDKGRIGNERALLMAAAAAIIALLLLRR